MKIEEFEQSWYLKFLELNNWFMAEVDKSMKRPFWYFRPSHVRLMKDWDKLLDILDK